MLVELTLSDGSKLYPAFDPGVAEQVLDFYSILKADGEIQDYRLLDGAETDA